MTGQHLQNKDVDREHRHVEFRSINLLPALLFIELPEEDHKIIGNALFLHNGKKQAIMWHIFIKETHRRKGFASNLLSAAKEIFDEIATDWESSAGHDLCVKNGFKKREAEQLKLVWKKGE